MTHPCLTDWRESQLANWRDTDLNPDGKTMEYTATLPTEVGLYRHRWDFRGQMREQVLFVGYTNARAPRLQGSEPNSYMPRTLRCCKPDEHLHADRMTPQEWGGWWARIETPSAD